MKKFLKVLGMALLTSILLAAFYLAVIMGDPQEEAPAALPAEEQPLLSAMGAPLVITDENRLNVLLQAFPARVMAAGRSSVLSFVQGECQDVPFEGGLGRKVTLTYRTAEGAAVTVSSIYPARAISLIDKAGYTITSAGLSLAGLRSVRMESGASVRMHAQGSDALYVVTLPPMSDRALRTYTSILALYQGE